jgi:hypothetical protein
MIKEKRSSSRVQTRTEIEVIDKNTGAQLGRLVNISNEGFMLVGKDVIEPNQLFELRLVLSQPVSECEVVECGAESLWNNSASHASYHWTGFHIIDISDEYSAIIDELMRQDEGG